jgi:hypothetical protein
MRRSLPIFVLLALLLVGCGGGAEETTQSTTAQKGESRSYVAAADRICAGMVADSRRMAVEFSRYPNDEGLPALTVTTRELVEPALPVLERSARRLRALEQGADSVAFASYVTLYDPIVAVVRDRVEAGEAGDATRAHALELQMLDLSGLQRQLAREAGLKACDIDFIHTFATSGGAR